MLGYYFNILNVVYLWLEPRYKNNTVSIGCSVKEADNCEAALFLFYSRSSLCFGSYSSSLGENYVVSKLSYMI